MVDVPDWVITILRYVIPALVGTAVGVYLEAALWKGRGAQIHA